MRYFVILFILLSVFNFTCRLKSSPPKTFAKLEVFSPDEIIFLNCGEYINSRDNGVFYLSVYNGDSDTILASITENAPLVNNLLDYKVAYCEIINADTIWSAPIQDSVPFYTDTIFPNCKKIIPLGIFDSSLKWLNSPNTYLIIIPALHSRNFDEIGKSSYYNRYPIIVLTKDTLSNKIIDVSQSFLK